MTQTADLDRVFNQQRAVLGMDSSPLRFDWRRGLAESMRATLRRRRNMLAAAGLHLSAQYREWVELSTEQRLAMDKALGG